MSSRKKYVNKDEEQHWFLRPLHPKNNTQQHYVDCLKESKICFGVGPAGTGKTFVAAHIALEKLYAGDIERILVTRPMMATEDIGYLPGTLEEKIHPYLLPLLDSFEDHIGVSNTKDFIADGKIEVSPLAFMRGRSLNNAFIILDEGQNVTREQMKMFLTRMGFNTTLAINGDTSQSDLANKSDSGLAWAVDRLSGVSKDITVVEFARKDIVRNPLIEVILQHLESPNIPKREIYDAPTETVSRRRKTNGSAASPALPMLFKNAKTASL